MTNKDIIVPSDEIVVPNETKEENVARRVKKFGEGLKKLIADTEIGAKAQITTDGPVIVNVDLKQYEDTTTK